MRHAEFEDPRLVVVYDAQNRWGRDDDFFLGAVGERPRQRVLDLGCGTGRLSVAVAAAGHSVTGVDPARASLDVARRRPGAEQVTWVEGTSENVPAASFDVALMTSHVAQIFVDDAAWKQVLTDLRRCVVPGGRLLFDARDPVARAWLRWNPEQSRARVLLGEDGEETEAVEVWSEVTAVRGDVVQFTMRYEFSAGERLESTAELRFRNEDQLRSTLAASGWTVEHVYGGWNCEPVGSGADELVVVAHAAGHHD